MNEKEWRIPFVSGETKIRLEHSFTSGRRTVFLDDKIVFEDKWRMAFTGVDQFKLGKNHSAKLIINTNQVKAGFFESLFGGSNSSDLDYKLLIDGMSEKDFIRKQEKVLRAWKPFHKKKKVFLDTTKLEVWFKGREVESTQNFIEDGTEMTFCIDGKAFSVRNLSSGSKHEGLVYEMYMDGEPIPQVPIL